MSNTRVIRDPAIPPGFEIGALSHYGLLAQHLYPRAATPAQVIWGNVFRGQFGRNFVNPHVQGTKTQFLGSLVSRAEIGHFLYMEIIKA